MTLTDIINTSASGCTVAFVQLAFTINTLFSLYGKFRNLFVKHIQDECDNLIAESSKVLALPEDQLRAQRVKVRIRKIGIDLDEKTEEVEQYFIKVSFIFAVICLGILYFRLTDLLGYFNLLLLIPIYLFAKKISSMGAKSYAEVEKEREDAKVVERWYGL